MAVGIRRLGDIVGKIQQRGRLVVEGRTDLDLFGVFRAQPPAQVVEAFVGGQGGRGENHAGLLIPQVLLHEHADMQRRYVERQHVIVSGLDFDPIDKIFARA